MMKIELKQMLENRRSILVSHQEKLNKLQIKLDFIKNTDCPTSNTENSLMRDMAINTKWVVESEKIIEELECLLNKLD